MVQLVGVLGALAATVAFPYEWFYGLTWAFLALGVNGITIGILSQYRGGRPGVRFGWTTAVINIVVWGAGVLFPRSLGLDPLVGSRSFELAFRVFALGYGVVTMFLGIQALLAMRRLRRLEQT